MLPSAVVAALDFTTLTVEPGSLVDPERTALETDLVYRVQLAGEDAFVFVLFEHQSSEDAVMPFRMARYMMRIWERWLRAQESPPSRVPVIVPLLLNNDVKPWTAPRTLRALYAAPEHVLAALGPHLLDMTLCLDDLPALDPAAIKARVQLHHFGRLALFALQRSRTAPDLVAELAVWLDLVRELVRTAQGLEYFTLLICYIHHTADFAPGSLRHLVRNLGPRIEEAAMTAADRLRAEGRAEGEAKGKAEGKAKGKAEGEAKGKAEGEAKGKAEGKAELLLKLLTLRFGDLPQAARARLASADDQALMRFTERVLHASSLDEVLA